MGGARGRPGQLVLSFNQRGETMAESARFLPSVLEELRF